MATLSNSNSKLALTVRGLYPVPQSIQGYATDDSFATNDVQPAQIMMGVDGRQSAGFVPYSTEFTVTLQADSPSLTFFDAVLEGQKAQKEVFIFDGTILIQGTGEKYAMTNGVVSSATPMATGKKTLQSRKFTITFESVTKAPI